MSIKIKCKENGLEKRLHFDPHDFQLFPKGAKFNYTDESNQDLDGVYKVKKIKTERISIKGYSIRMPSLAIVRTPNYILEVEKLKDPCKKSFMERLYSYF